MGRDNVDEIKLTVPYNVGYLLGDFLRKFAIRGVPTWRIVGYKVDSTCPNFGFSDGPMASYLKLMDGNLVLERDIAGGEPMIKKFTWDGKAYRCGDMYIEGLNHGFGETLTVALNYTNSVMNTQQNYEVCKRIVGGEAEGFFAVPSRHTDAKLFKFDVVPVDDKSECLVIKADSDVLHSAYECAVKSVTGLNL